MGLKVKIKNGYNLYYLYQYLFDTIMFNPRYKNVNNKLLKKYITHCYIKLVTNKTKERNKKGE